MRTFYPFPIEDINVFKLQLLEFSKFVSHFCYLDSNNYPDYPHSTFGSFFAIDAIDTIAVNHNCLEQFEAFQNKNQDWMFGFLNYDLKNEIEPGIFSDSKYPKKDKIHNPLLHFFVPKFLIKIENESVEIGINREEDLNDFIRLLPKTISNMEQVKPTLPVIQNRISKEEYILAVEKIKQHIQRGDIYEMNFCQEFFTENSPIDPVVIFKKLNLVSKAPFTSFFKNKHSYLMCASPERFLKRWNNQLISQPIKGTRKRIKDAVLDNLIKEELFHDEKERSENVMIVDLVRNDFSKIAIKNSVAVEELFGIYTFEQVHQMISTITCTINPEITFFEIIKAVFPMGSMTGAPKISAMQLIDTFEQTQRGLYSGAVGYITPKGNFDFNVVIRSIIYNEDNECISIQAGSAITTGSNASHEYDECLLKANAMLKAIK